MLFFKLKQVRRVEFMKIIKLLINEKYNEIVAYKLRKCVNV